VECYLWLINVCFKFSLSSKLFKQPPSLISSGSTAFGIEYGSWVEEQNRQIDDLRNALDSNISDAELHLLVEVCMKHYYELFRLKAMAAKSDVFYLMSGMWKTSVERLFLWIGGFRPSELLQVTDILELNCYVLTNIWCILFQSRFELKIVKLEG
jgi:hypothetical protein